LKYKKGVAASLKKERLKQGEVDSDKSDDEGMAGPSLALFMPQTALPEK
jgi:hypothetical protein